MGRDSKSAYQRASASAIQEQVSSPEHVSRIAVALRETDHG